MKKKKNMLWKFEKKILKKKGNVNRNSPSKICFFIKYIFKNVFIYSCMTGFIFSFPD